MKTVSRKQLPPGTSGTARLLTVVRYGTPGNRPKAYLQAGLHADEAPGFVVIHHLCRRLDQAAAAGHIRGEIVIVPAANPIGLAQWHNDVLQGRFDDVNAINFNRSHCWVTETVAERIQSSLGAEETQNIAIIRTAMKAALAELEPDSEAGHLKRLLLGLSCDADIVLDLHCDLQAMLHVYLGTPLWPDAADLPACLGAEVVLLAQDSGGTPFDEANSRPWWELAARFADKPIPPACLAATIELRGICDTAQETAQQDAEKLFAFLQRRGCIAGEQPPLPEMHCAATPLAGVDYVKSPGPGTLVFLKEPGDMVAAGEPVALLFNPTEPDSTGDAICSVTDGRLFARVADRSARTGRIIAKVAGTIPLRPDHGNLLTL